jgi:hypothetical protein
MSRFPHAHHAHVVAVSIVLAALAAACSRAEAPAAARTEAKPAAPVAPVSAPGLSTVLGKAPAGAVVSLEPADGREVPLPPGPAVLDQLGKQFVPNLLMVRVGQPVEFRNSEDMPHNVFVIRRRVGSTVFDVSTDPFQRYTHAFDRAGEYEVSCTIHPGMNATIIATRSPHAAVADARGGFTILNVPPGAYTLIVSDAGSPTETPVEVAGPVTELAGAGR